VAPDPSTFNVDTELETLRLIMGKMVDVIESVDDLAAHNYLCMTMMAEIPRTITDQRSKRLRQQVARGWSRAMLAAELGLTRARVDQLITR
jgi:hypothetical protein